MPVGNSDLDKQIEQHQSVMENKAHKHWSSSTTLRCASSVELRYSLELVGSPQTVLVHLDLVHVDDRPRYIRQVTATKTILGSKMLSKLALCVVGHLKV